MIQLKKLELEKARVYAARLDLELKYEELKEALIRVEENIQIQVKKEQELEAKISEMKGRA